MSDDERSNLATLYAPGQTLWRTPLPHFSYVDNNWGFIPADVSPPTESGPVNDDPLQDPQACHGCIVEMENQVLGQSVAIVGTPFSLNYRSDRESGHLRERTIQLSGASPLSPQLASIGLTLAVAGRTFEQTFAPGQNQSFTFVWDGKDAYGRTVQGGQVLTGSIDYHYPASYAVNPAVAGGASFAVPPGSNFQLLEGFRDGTYAASRPFSTIIGEGLTDARALGLGGWTLSVQHFFDPSARVVHMGDGTRRRADSLTRVLNTVVQKIPDGFATNVAIGPDGSIYYALQDPKSFNRIVVRRLAPDGTDTRFAGGGTADFPDFGNGGPALQATILGAVQLIAGHDGTLYILDSSAWIRQVGLDGIIRKVAGNHSSFPDNQCDGADGQLAAEVDLCMQFFAVAPDGTLYVETQSEFDTAVRFRHIGADGILTTIAGNGASCDEFPTPCGGDGGPATAATVAMGPVAVGPDGSVYLGQGDRIRRVTPDGIIGTFAGQPGNVGFGGDGGPASNALFAGTTDLAFGADGSLYVVDSGNGRLRRIGADGIVASIAGSGPNTCFCDLPAFPEGTPAQQAAFSEILNLVVEPAGTLLVTIQGLTTDALGNPLRVIKTMRLGTVIPGLSNNSFLLASDDGAELYVFDANGLHLRTLNALTGATLYEFAYDANGHLSQVTEKTGGTDNVTTIEHDANGNPAAIVGPFGQRTVLTVDGNGFLASIANPAGETIRMSSDVNGLMSAYTDPRGKASSYNYDAAGHLLHEADPAGGGQDLARTVTPPGSVVVDASTALGRTSTYRVDNLAGDVQKRSMTAPDGTTTLSEQAIDAASTTITSADGTVSNIQQAPDPQFFMTAPIDKAFSLALPSGLTLAGSQTRTAVLANSSDQLSLVSLAGTSTVDGRTATSAYLAAARTLTLTSAAGRASSVTVDALGRIASSQFGGLAPVAVSYDSRGRVASIARASGTETRKFSFAYNGDGYLQSITDPIGRTAQYAYDAAGRVVGKTFPDGRIVAFGYDAAGNVTSFTPPSRPAYAFAYSDRDELIGMTPPTVAGTGPTGYAYDLDRMPTAVSRPDGRTVTLGYDAGGRVASRSFANGGVTTGADILAYDSAGRLASIVAASGESTSYGYDGSVLASKSWSGPINGSVSRTFDTGFRIASESVDAVNTIAFAYDSDGLLIGAGDLTLTRDPQTGLVTGSRVGNVTTSITYDAFGDATGYSASNAATPIFAESLTRDALGRITQKIESVGGASDTYAYSYDRAGQLLAVTRNAVAAESYVYDANGNRTGGSLAGSAIDATYDDQNRLVLYNGATFAYNAAGDLVSKTSAAQTTAYQYDAIGNLLAVTLPSGKTISYIVDGRNRRVGKKVNGTLVKGFLYGDALRIAAELDGTGAVVSRFVYANGRVPVYMTKAGASFRLITDQVGSVRRVVDAQTGVIAQRIDYDTFGNVALDTNPGFQPFGFAGGLYDPDSGLVRFGARDYDAGVGRWTARDPSLFEGGEGNLYRYASADPVNSYDAGGDATLDAGSFPEGDEEQQLLNNIGKALTQLTGTPGKDNTWSRSPKKLRKERDFLSDDFRDIWKNTVIRYDPNCTGATSTRNAKGGADIVVGPWFLQKQFTKQGFTREIEKIILHEYLHQALDQPYMFSGQPDRNDLQHGFIDQVIQFNLGYKGSPNPGAP